MEEKIAIQIGIVKGLLESGNIKFFREVFLYVPRTTIAKMLGINYGRFLALIKHPERLRYAETLSIAKIFRVSPRLISEIIHNQLEYGKIAKSKTK
jgi:hypothetical protein